MAAGSSSQKNFRKALGAIKDSTSVGMAKVNSEYKALTVSILKATNHDDVLPKEKHVRIILEAVSGSRPRADVFYCINALTKRLAKTRTWVVALKTLIVIHRALREVDQSFTEELIYYNRNRGQAFSLFHFNDDSSPAAWDYSAWIHAYAHYIEEYLDCFRVLRYSFHNNQPREKKFETRTLLKQLPALQQLLFRLLNCQPVGLAQYNFIIQYALSIVALDSVRLYVAITDGVLILVDKFFEMKHRDAVKALDIYRRAMEQALGLSEFFEMCRRLDFGRGQKYVIIEPPPASFLATMVEYVDNYSEGNDEEVLSNPPELVVLPDANPDSDINGANDVEKGSQPSTSPEKVAAEAAPMVFDLLSWDEPTQESSQVIENGSFNTSGGPENSSPLDNWELMLVSEASFQAATSTEESKEQSSAPNILDRSVLDTLYDIPNAESNPNQVYHDKDSIIAIYPFQGNTYTQPYYNDPTTMMFQSLMQAPSPIPQQNQQLHNQMCVYNYLQIAGIETQNAQSVQEPLGASTPLQVNQHVFAPYEYMETAEIAQPHQLRPIFFEQQEQQSSSPFYVGQSMMLMRDEMNQFESEVGRPMAVVDHGSSNLLGNPFEDQSLLLEKKNSIPVTIAPQAQSPSQALHLSFI